MTRALARVVATARPGRENCAAIMLLSLLQLAWIDDFAPPRGYRGVGGTSPTSHATSMTQSRNAAIHAMARDCARASHALIQRRAAAGCGAFGETLWREID